MQIVYARTQNVSPFGGENLKVPNFAFSIYFINVDGNEHLVPGNENGHFARNVNGPTF